MMNFPEFRSLQATIIRSILIIIVAITSGSAFSCSCVSLERLNKQLVSELKHAYHGTIIEISEDTARSEIRYKLLVARTYIGEQRDTVEFSSNNDGAVCGITTSIGDEWILTWKTDETVPHLSICSRVYDFSDLKSNKRYFRFRFGHGVHKSLRKA